MSISSLLIQYSINSFGADAAAGMVVFSRVEGFLYYPAFSYGMALTGFIGQNYGAHRMDRVKEGMKESVITLSAFTVAAGGILMAAAPGDPETVHHRSGDSRERAAGDSLHFPVLFPVFHQSGLHRRAEGPWEYRLSDALLPALLLHFPSRMVPHPSAVLLGHPCDLFQL